MFNELCLLAISYHLVVFSNHVDSAEVKYTFGWLVIAITLFNIAANMLVVLAQGVQQFKQKYLQLRDRCRKRRV